MKDSIKVRDFSGCIFNVVYVPEAMCWIQEGTDYYYDIEDWENGVIVKINEDEI